MTVQNKAIMKNMKRRATSAAIVRWLPAFAALAFTLIVQSAYSTSPAALLWYVFMFLFVVTGTGTLVYRALLGSTRVWLGDLALGTSVGLLMQLGFWAIFVSLGMGSWLWVGALLVYALFALVPRLRVHYYIPKAVARRVPCGVSWALAAVYGLALVVNSSSFAMKVPPGNLQWYQDEFWHLGNAAWLLNHVVPQDMRVAGEGLTYHWFSSAHVAAQSLATNLDLNLVVARLWAVPVYGAVVVLMAVVGWQLSGSWWSGVLATIMMVSAAQLRLAWVALPDGNALTVHSPSQVYSVLAMLLIVSLLAKRWNDGRLSIPGWILLAGTFVAAPGAKSSLLPVLICGLGVAVVVAVLERHDIQGTVAAFVLSIVALVVSFRFLGAGGEQIRIQVFSTLRQVPFYVEQMQLDPAQRQFGGGLFPPRFLTLWGIITVAVILLLYVARYVWLVAAVPVLVAGEKKICAWFLVGVGFAGFAAAMLVNHDGMSQLYFFRGGLVAWYLVASWGLCEAWRRSDPGSRLRVLVGSAAAGGAYFTLWSAVAGGGPVIREHSMISVFLGAMVALVPVAVVGALILKKRGGFGRTAALSISAALIAGSVFPGIANPRLAEIPPPDKWAVTSAETEAALWIRDNSEPDDIVATNVHCTGRQGPQCDARSYWVSGLTQRRVFVEGWGYSRSMRAEHGANGLWYGAQPFLDTNRFELNEAAFVDPSEETLDALADRGVTWLFADNHRSEISPELNGLAERVYSNDDVSVYRIGDL